MANINPAEIAMTLTVASIQAGNAGRTPEEVSKYYVEIFKHICELGGDSQKPQEFVFRWDC